MNFIKLFPSFHDKNKNIVACFAILFDEYNNEFEKQTLDSGIYCRKYYIPLQLKKNSDYIYNHILCFPCTIEMNNTDIDRILDIITSTNDKIK
jgi:dTDP-4-amino-4,6-dideoxygalactose transaminase